MWAHAHTRYPPFENRCTNQIRWAQEVKFRPRIVSRLQQHTNTSSIYGHTILRRRVFFTARIFRSALPSNGGTASETLTTGLPIPMNRINYAVHLVFSTSFRRSIYIYIRMLYLLVEVLRPCQLTLKWTWSGCLDVSAGITLETSDNRYVFTDW